MFEKYLYFVLKEGVVDSGNFSEKDVGLFCPWKERSVAG